MSGQPMQNMLVSIVVFQSLLLTLVLFHFGFLRPAPVYARDTELKEYLRYLVEQVPMNSTANRTSKSTGAANTTNVTFSTTTPPIVEAITESITRKQIMFLDPHKPISDKESRIPHIIHQTWDAPTVPQFFEQKIKSWVSKHPDWEYWFWSAKDIKLLISRCFPEQFLTTYTRYRYVVNRADSMRYFALYLFGGLYMDLDVVALKSHEKLIDSHPCIVTQETYEHSVLLYNNVKNPNLVNAYIGCRPRHPFMRMMVEDLPSSAGYKDNLRKTGPFYENVVYHKYNTTRRDRGWTRTVDDIHELEPKWVMPTFDPGQLSNLRRRCLTLRNKQPFYVEVCKEFTSKHSKNNVPGPDALANHLWTHTYLNERKWKTQKGLTIDQIVPGRVNVTQRILEACPT